MSKSDGVTVSREVLKTMQQTLTDLHDQLAGVLILEPFELGRRIQEVQGKLLDLELAVRFEWLREG